MIVLGWFWGCSLLRFSVCVRSRFLARRTTQASSAMPTEACGCCCGDGSTADDDGSTADSMMRQLRSDASKRLQAVRTAEVIGAALETQAAMLPCRTGQAARLPCCASPTILSYCGRRTMTGWIMADWMCTLLVYVQLRSRDNFNQGCRQSVYNNTKGIEAPIINVIEIAWVRG